jgi:hypothetical protein
MRFGPGRTLADLLVTVDHVAMGLNPHARVTESTEADLEHRAMHALESDVSLFKQCMEGFETLLKLCVVRST